MQPGAAMEERLVALLGGGAPEREQAYCELAEHAHSPGEGGLADFAVACVASLCSVLCRDLAEVSSSEYRRVFHVLTALSGADPLRVGGQFNRPGQCNIHAVVTAPGSALAVVLAKQPAALTNEDVITVSGFTGCMAIQYSTQLGIDATASAAGISTQEYLAVLMPTMCLVKTSTPEDHFSLSLVPLALNMLKAPQKLPELTLAGIFYMVLMAIIGRPVVARAALELGAVDILVNILRDATPTELIATAGHAQKPHGLAISVMKDLVEAAQAGKIDMTTQLLSSGYIDILISALSAVEQLGAENVNAEVVTYGGLWFLKCLDGEAIGQIQDKLRAAPAMLRFMVDSNIVSVEFLGQTSGVLGTVLAANLYGKDEDNAFGFVRESDIY